MFVLHFVIVLFLVGYWKRHCYGDCCFDNARDRFCLLVLDVGRFGVVFELCCIVFGRIARNGMKGMLSIKSQFGDNRGEKNIARFFLMF